VAAQQEAACRTGEQERNGDSQPGVHGGDVAVGEDVTDHVPELGEQRGGGAVRRACRRLAAAYLQTGSCGAGEALDEARPGRGGRNGASATARRCMAVVGWLASIAPGDGAAQGILERRRYSEHPPRYEYQLTEKGLALFPVIAALTHWGDTWAARPGGPPVVLVHDTCGNVTQPVLTCPHCHGEVSPGNTHSGPGPGACGPPHARQPHNHLHPAAPARAGQNSRRSVGPNHLTTLMRESSTSTFGTTTTSGRTEALSFCRRGASTGDPRRVATAAATARRVQKLGRVR
jgi:HxlR-like helix-turn-helix